MYFLSVCVCFTQFVNIMADFPYAKCSVVTQDINASAQIFITDLIPVFDMVNLTSFLASFETKIVEQLGKMHSKIEVLDEKLSTSMFDKTIAYDNIQNRKIEMQKYNATIHAENNGNVFTYYWKLQGIEEIMYHKTKPIRSHSFYIYPKGYRMYLKFLPKFNSNYFNVQVGVSQGDYDDVLKWPFNLKYRISILDQNDEGNVFDMMSKIWTPQEICRKSFWSKPISDNHGCIGISFTEEMLSLKSYIKDNCIVVKLTLYLN